MSKDSEQKRERRLFKIRSSILKKRRKMEKRKMFWAIKEKDETFGEGNF